ncbi:MAG: redoxin domain-containing protein [Candidatus Sumerlaeia bacterium]|nr:redoxin domain-containing protein [Candidatus Sumerlaeia bacterium]
MKKFLSMVAVVFALGVAGGFTSAAQAGGGCAVSCGADKVAKSCDATEQVAMVKGGAAQASDCAVSCGADKVSKSDCSAKSCDAAEQVAMVKGGAAQTSDCAASCGADKVAKSDCAAKCGEKCEKAEQVAMAKGGAAEGVAQGYALGKQVPNFTLNDIHGKSHSLSDYRGKVVPIIFWNHRCPWVVEMDDRLADFTDRYADKDVVVLTVDAGINNSVEDIKEYGKEFPFHLLVNRDSELARNFDAKFTPEVFLLDREGVVVYHGAFDNSRAGSDADGTRVSYMEDAVKAIIENRDIDVVQTRAFGCTIKFAPKAEAASAGTY